MKYLKIRNIDNVLVNSQDSPYPTMEYYYSVEVEDFSVPPGLTYSAFQWDTESEEIVSFSGDRRSIGYNGEEPVIKYPYLIYKNINQFNNEYETPFEIDFTILGLYRIPTIIDGELSNVTYYKDINIDKTTGEKTFINPAVKKDITYTKVDGYLSYRTTLITWYYDNGEADTINTKTVVKYYNPSEAIAAGVNRRSYGIDNVKILTAYLISQTQGITPQEAEEIAFPYLAEITPQINYYVSGYVTPMINIVGTSTTYEATDKYVFGARVFKDDICYKCNVLDTTGEWNPSNWVEEFSVDWLNNPINQQGTKIRELILNELITYQ